MQEVFLFVDGITYRLISGRNMKENSIAVSIFDQSQSEKGKALAEKLNLPFVDLNCHEFRYLLVITDQYLELRTTLPKGPKPLYIDFVAGKMAHRFKEGGGKRQLLARAVGLGKNPLNLLDVTAGLGQDAFVLAYLGCSVTMVERSPVIGALVEDALQRIRSVDELNKLAITLVIADARNYLRKLEDLPDVIYLDPMFPVDEKKTALAKKEMRMLRDIVGEDLDAAELFQLAIQKAKKRVVVKRHRFAPTIDSQPPDLVMTGKSSRFDIYFS